MASNRVIYFVRHPQAEHNASRDWSIPDPPLTPLGKQQAEDLNESTSDNIQATADLLVTSPFTRTLQTTQIGLPKLKSRMEAAGQKLIVLSRLQEEGVLPCDIGKSREVLEKTEEFEGIDFSPLEDDWNVKVGDFAPENIVARAKWVRKWLRARPEREIVAVSHGALLLVITNTDQSDRWGHGEIRSFTFVEDDDEDAVLRRIT
ncbi:hypothetical protein BS47DRAFT_1347824 [Hydnum rufescens UP504]|uniref:Phosphoglycerate mutase-like protein n=1 Tax=Hydnum rufescens UP504 TaxID=1448309 RepID=A0A9P6DTK4_9AGAM|nr:hypothetical protein BS47DRAFT_1347824 [Hydnum rufescens UP504]